LSRIYSDSCEQSWLVVELPEISARPEYPWIGLRENQSKSEPEIVVDFTALTIQIYNYGVSGTFSPSTSFNRI